MSRPPKKPDPDLDAKISVLYLCGHSTVQVARRLGLNTEAVRNSLKRTKTPMRSISEAQRLRSGWY